MATARLRKRKAVLKDRAVEIKSDEEFRIGDIDFVPFSVPHDAVDNFGFVAKHDGVKIATLMDFGHISDEIKAALCGCDADHHRIKSQPGHASYLPHVHMGPQAAHHVECRSPLKRITRRLAANRLRWMCPRHRSCSPLQRANEPHLARIMAETALKMRPPLFRSEAKISLSSHRQPTDWFALSRLLVEAFPLAAAC